MNTLIKGLFILVYFQQPPLSSLLRSQEEVSNSILTIEDLILLQLKINTQYHLYIRPLSGLIKLKSILNLILLPPLTISEYRKVINGKLHLYYALANLNTPLCPLVYIMAQAPSKAILIMPYGTTLITSALCTQIIYLFTVITLLSILSIFKRFQSALGIQDFILI